MPGWRLIRALKTFPNSGRLIKNSSWRGWPHRTSSSRRPCVHALRTYDHAVIRVGPRLDRGEFVNAGIILSCDIEPILLASIGLGEKELLPIDSHVDLVI